MNLENLSIGVIGLGYVGLPLAAILSEKYNCLGFDISTKRVEELNNGVDLTGELTNERLNQLTRLSYTSKPNDLSACNFFIVTVPTPVSKSNVPDFRPLESASKIIGAILKKGDVVVYESTVYPGATEEICIPILEETSGLSATDDFLYGYSPERINPGDTANRVENIVKVTSGCNEYAAEIIDGVYSSVIIAGTFKASSVRVAEAAKVIENAQRDVNIAFMNQIALIFEKLEINTSDVLAAAATKWNFLPFSPGLVGGHCIGVDPYYLIAKSEEVGCNPRFLKVAREINEGMAAHIVERIKTFFDHDGQPRSVLILGATFKEDCPDLRNSKVKELHTLLTAEGFECSVIDPVADADEMRIHYGDAIDVSTNQFDAVILAVPHSCFFVGDHLVYENRTRSGGLIFDVKSKLKSASDSVTLFQL